MIGLSRYSSIVLAVLAVLILVRCGKDSPTRPQPPAPAKISITPDSLTLTATGQTTGLNAEIRDQNDGVIADSDVTWSSSNTAVASVNAQGIVIAHSHGSSRITATSGSVSGSIEVTVSLTSFRIVIAPSMVSLDETGQTKQLSASVYDRNNNLVPGATLIWSSNDTKLAAVTSQGVVSAIGTGNVLVTASSGNTSSSVGVSIGTANEDKAVLVALYNATNGPNWTNSENWLSDAPLGEWHGLQTNDQGRVVRIRLGNNNMSGSIPAELGQLTNLGYLDLGINHLTGEIPVELGQLANLFSLHLFVNNLTGAVPSELGQLSNLSLLNLRSNPRLSGTLPGSLTNLPLAHLYLSNTALCAPLTTEFQIWLNTIREKDVVNCADPDRDALIVLYNGTAGTSWMNSVNWLSYEPLGAWYGVTADTSGRVTGLNLANNNLNGSLPSEAGRLSELTTLNLASNSALFGPIPRQLTDLGLQVLNLNETNLCAPAEEPFTTWLRGIPNKNVTDCAADAHPDWNAMVAFYYGTGGANWTNNTNWLSTSPMSEWIGVTTSTAGRVTGLDLANNNLRGTVPSGIAGLAELNNLNLAGNSLLTGQLPREITAISLASLDLEGTQLCVPPDIEFQTWFSSIPTRQAETCTDPRPDWDALVALYNATYGPNWTNSENWLSDAPLGEWHGLQTNDQGRVFRIRLGNNNMSGSIPAELGQLTNLGYLDLGINRLTGEIPSELGQLAALRELYLGWNDLTGAVPFELGQLSNLKRLGLNSNAELSGTLPSALTDLPLEYLHLGNTKLCAPASSEFQIWLNTIREKDVVNCADPDRDALIALYNGTAGTSWMNSANWLSYEPLGAWYGVTADTSGRVTGLNLENNNLNGSLPSEAGRLSELTTLNLASNSALYGPIPRQLTDLGLQVLNLNETNLCAPAEEPFTTWLRGIPNKNVTDCAADAHPDWNAMVAFYYGTGGANWTNNTNWLSTSPMSEWIGVTTSTAGRVTGLDLANNNLRGTVPSGIAGLAELNNLNLAGNSLLTGQLPREITAISLASLDLEGTQLCVPPDIEFQTWFSSIPTRQAETCTDPRPDWDALVALYNATNGPNWTNSENWLSDAPLVEWHGIGTDGGGRVVRIQLRNNNLSGSIPSELQQLTNLGSLNLEGNRLTGEIPSELGELKNLIELYMRNNELTGSIPVEFGQLITLRNLNLSWNDLTGAVPFELGQLSNLKRLGLNSNAELSGTLPSALTDLPLEYLHLGNTKLCAPASSEFQAWLATIENKTVTYCSDLDIGALTAFYDATGGPEWTNSDNWLSEVPVSDWYGVTADSDGRVRGLDLKNNNLNGSLPAEIAKLTNLASLYLSNNEGLIGALPNQLTGLVLESLDLDGTHLCAPKDAGFQTWIENIPQRSVATCVVLDTDALTALVGLYNATDGANWTNKTNWLSQAPLAAWHGVTVDPDGNVTELILNDNNLSGGIPSDLSKLSSLTKFDFTNNDGLFGPLPQSLRNLPVESLNLSGTRLCAPANAGFQSWLNTITGTTGVTTCMDSHPDWEALVAIYNETNGPNWTDNTNWLSAEPMDKWYGVTTDHSGRVTKLELARNNLLGTVPEELGHLKELQYLRLGFNELSGPIPPELGNLQNLRLLGIHSCWLSGTIPKELGQLRNLVELSLWGNGSTLAGLLPPELGQLSNLRTLWLAANGFTGPIPPEIGQMNNLREFDLRWNSLTGRIPRELGQLSKLKSLRIIRNKLTGPLPPELGQLSSLEILELSQNQISGPLPPELGRLSNLQVMNLSNNRLHGSIPSDLGRLSVLNVLALAGNPEMSGRLPLNLTQLNLEKLMLGDTQLCVPPVPEFQIWLRSVENSRVIRCAVPVTATAYLTQATQSLEYPVPLVAGEDALLRVFLKSDEEIDITMPPVRATFYHGGSVVHIAEVAGEDFSVPATFDENLLQGSANLRVPGSVIFPGLEAVIETDPDETLNSDSGVVTRIPETGRMSFDVRQLPTLDLTMVPFLWVDGPELSVLSVVNGLTPESELMRPTHDLLPVGDFRLNVHAPVWTSVDPISDSVPVMGPELQAIYAIEGSRGYYMGIFRAQGPSGLLGIAAGIPSYTSFSVLDPYVIAHELGHNLNLYHAPCGGAAGPDPFFPYEDGSVGTSGFDVLSGSLVEHDTWELMSYCRPQWISDYSFARALNHRMAEGAKIPRIPVVAAKGLLLWGGMDLSGELFLEPAFVVDAPLVLPQEDGPYVLTGEREDGSELFTLSFAISEYADAEGGSFAFIVPVQDGWSDMLDRITLSGPEGIDSIDGEGDSHYALMRDGATGEVRGILRDWPDPTNPSTAGRRIPPEPGLEIVTSGGIPDSDEW